VQQYQHLSWQQGIVCQIGTSTIQCASPSWNGHSIDMFLFVHFRLLNSSRDGLPPSHTIQRCLTREYRIQETLTTLRSMSVRYSGDAVSWLACSLDCGVCTAKNCIFLEAFQCVATWLHGLQPFRRTALGEPQGPQPRESQHHSGTPRIGQPKPFAVLR
jgi:hypothetical protein